MFESLIARGTADGPKMPAVRVGLGQVHSYDEMFQTIRRATAWLATRRIAKGTRVVIQVPDPYVFWVLAHACEALGLVFVGEVVALPMTTERVRFLGVGHVLSSHPASDGHSAGWSQIGAAWRQMIKAFRAVPLPARSRSPDDDICIVLSSGTTGLPKKVLLDRRMLDLRLAHARESFEDGQIGGALLMLPVHSLGGLLASLLAWSMRRTLVFHQSGEPVDRLMIAGAVGSVTAAPIHLEQMIAGLPADMPRPDSFVVTTGGGILSPTLAAQIQQRLTDDIRMAYGSTESGIVTRGTVADPRTPSECAGMVLPWANVEIVDVTGTPKPTGELGEVRIRGGEVVAGYLEMPADTATYFRGGWYHPGDLGRFNDDGTLVIEGRIDELLNFGGRKSLPNLIETALLRIPFIVDVAVLAFGGTGGQRLGVAYVAATDIERERFSAVLEDFIDPHIVRVRQIPRNPMGKIDRPSLRREIEAAVAPGAV